jgi:8-oxo-dGTP pyrophosphatase MutT (NUDIX family)
MKISDEYVKKTIRSFAETLPTFPDGRIDYSHANKAPVITVFIFSNDRMLLLKRSDKVQTYQGKWNAVAGYLDEIKPLKEKINEEIFEETGITKEAIKSYHLGKPYTFTDKERECTWIVHPVKVILKKQQTITLDWEHTEYTWIHPEEIMEYDTVPHLKKSLHLILDEH